MMNVNQLVGRQVQIGGADPDLFGSPVSATVRAVDSNSKALLLEFIPPVQAGEKTYPFAVTSPRLQRDGLEVLLMGEVLGCAVTCVPRDRYDSARPFDLSWWRGGGAAIGDLVLVSDSGSASQ